jgi:hypothetical protein
LVSTALHVEDLTNKYMQTQERIPSLTLLSNLTR